MGIKKHAAHINSTSRSAISITTMKKTIDAVMKLTQVLLLVILFSPEVLCAPKDCARLKQETFDLWLSVKETCDDGPKDCCQVRCTTKQTTNNSMLPLPLFQGPNSI